MPTMTPHRQLLLQGLRTAAGGVLWGKLRQIPVDCDDPAAIDSGISEGGPGFRRAAGSRVNEPV